MNHLIKYSGILAVALVFFGLGVTPSDAQSDVRMQISAQETYVGMPVTLYVQLEDVAAEDAPEFPTVDGMDVRSGGIPSRNTSITIINGRRSESSSVTFSYQFTPRREGIFEIPAITIETANGPRRTKAFRISATKSETGDLMFAEVAGQKEQLYVGQPIELSLRIWLKPYMDRQFQVTISAADMWQMIAQQSQWGPFAESLEKMAAEGRTLRGREVLRKDNDGVERSYYLYEVAATFYPKRAGQIEMEDVQIVAQYPTKLGQSRDPFASFFGDSSFGGRSPFGGSSPFSSMFDDDFFAGRGSPFGRSLTVTATRPIVVTPEVEPIAVTPIPTEGRPADYRGAVGQYQLITQATPTQVKAGDPITLKIGIRGTGPMELVQAPPLAEISSLSADFKVSDEPLAGVVQDDIKVFTTTIRPRREGINQVPPIPFSFFDPQIEEFVTIQSEPVAIVVDKAEKLAMDSIVGTAGGRRTNSPGPDAADSGPVLENRTDENLLSSQTGSPDARFWLTLFLSPVGLLGAFLLIRNWQRWAPQNETRIALGRINHANETREFARAILELIAAKRGLPANLTRPEAISEISGTVDSAIIRRFENFLVSCENAAFSGDASLPLPRAKQEARELVSQLAALHRSFSWRPKVQRPWRLGAAMAVALLLVVVIAYSLTTVFGVTTTDTKASVVQVMQPVELGESQKMTLLDEANEEYQRGLKSKENDAAEARSAFATAAQKYQLLADSGVHNAGLYFNLGNAYLQSDSLGRAIANYERSRKLRAVRLASPQKSGVRQFFG